MALWLERKTLIHEVGGSSPASGVSAPQIRGLDDRATTSIGQENRFQLKSDLHLGEFHRAEYSMGALHHGFMCAIQHPTLGRALMPHAGLEPTTS